MSSEALATDHWEFPQPAESETESRMAERKALHEWLAASKAWSEFNRGGNNGDMLLCKRQKSLRALEKHLNLAADIYEKARSRLS